MIDKAKTERGIEFLFRFIKRGGNKSAYKLANVALDDQELYTYRKEPLYRAHGPNP